MCVQGNMAVLWGDIIGLCVCVDGEGPVIVLFWWLCVWLFDEWSAVSIFRYWVVNFDKKVKFVC